MPRATSRVMTTRQWAHELHCHVETLRRAIRHKELLATIDPLSRGPTFLIRADDLAAFLEKRRTAR